MRGNPGGSLSSVRSTAANACIASMDISAGFAHLLSFRWIGFIK